MGRRLKRQVLLKPGNVPVQAMIQTPLGHALVPDQPLTVPSCPRQCASPKVIVDPVHGVAERFKH